MKKFLLLIMAFTCLTFSSFAQAPPPPPNPTIGIVHNNSSGGTDDGSLPVYFCTSQTYSANVAAFGRYICSYAWYVGGALYSTAPYITLTISGNTSIWCTITYDTLAFCNHRWAVTSNQINVSVYMPTLGGPGQVCTTPMNWTVHDLPDGIPVTWSVTGPLTIVSGQGTNWMQLEETPGSSPTTGSVTATIGTVCGVNLPPQTENVIIGVTTPISINGITNQESFAPNTTFAFSTTYGNDWRVSGGTILSGQGTNFIIVQTVNVASGFVPFEVDVRENNSCGVSPYFSVLGKVQAGGAGPHIIIGPNPASGTVTLSAPATATEAATTGTKTIAADAKAPPTAAGSSLPTTVRLIKIYDVSGRLRKTINNKGASLPLQLDVSDLPNGVYFVELIIANSVDRQKLVIQH